MTNYEKRFQELKKRYEDDSLLEELLDLHTKLTLSKINVLNERGIDTTGLAKEVAGVTALSVELFCKEVKEE